MQDAQLRRQEFGVLTYPTLNAVKLAVVKGNPFI
jgi:hypothetical protein